MPIHNNGSSYISGKLATWLGDKGMDHIRGAPMHPQTQGKIAYRHLQANACRPRETMASDTQEPHPA